MVASRSVSRSRFRCTAVPLALIFFACLSRFADAKAFSSCGSVSRRGDCWIFDPYMADDVGPVLLPDDTNVETGREYNITGVLEWSTAVCDDYRVYNSLSGVTVGPCIPEDLGCGILQMFTEEYNCVTWAPVDDPADKILVGGYGSFALGDTVHASGVRAFFPDICICACGVLLNATFSACGEVPVEDKTWGRIKARYTP